MSNIHIVIPDPVLCIKCLTEYVAPKRTSWCNTCRKEYERKYWAQKSKEARREKKLKHDFGISFVEFQALFDKQAGCCGICSCPLTLFKEDQGEVACVDHDHSSGHVRGLLCNHCNRALGLLKDDLTTIRNMERYLESHTHYHR